MQYPLIIWRWWVFEVAEFNFCFWKMRKSVLLRFYNVIGNRAIRKNSRRGQTQTIIKSSCYDCRWCKGEGGGRCQTICRLRLNLIGNRNRKWDLRVGTITISINHHQLFHMKRGEFFSWIFHHLKNRLRSSRHKTQKLQCIFLGRKMEVHMEILIFEQKSFCLALSWVFSLARICPPRLSLHCVFY